MKNYLVVGGSSGIGRSLSQILAVDSHVYASYFMNEKVDEKINYFSFNCVDEIDITQLPECIDGFAYCPGRINLKPFHRFAEADYIEDYQVQVLGAIKVLKAILPRLKAAESASVVFFSSVAVQTGFSFHTLVASSKGAIEGITRSLAAELSPKIRVNCIAPSITQTPLAENLLNTQDKIEANALRHPLKKVGQANDVAQLAAFLLGDKSAWITGQIIKVDGGISSLKLS
jgi:NAD(P)-dependent dehydrogenase (short-subunit alcohol dehydrogenase family)